MFACGSSKVHVRIGRASPIETDIVDVPENGVFLESIDPGSACLLQVYCGVIAVTERDCIFGDVP